MNLSFRSKLLALVATAGFALGALILASSIISGQVEKHLDDIRQHYLPKVGLRPQLEGQFERIQRGFQDAVAAGDTEKLGRTVELKKEFLQELAAASDGWNAVATGTAGHPGLALKALSEQNAINQAPLDMKFTHAATYSGHPVCCAVGVV